MDPLTGWLSRMAAEKELQRRRLERARQQVERRSSEVDRALEREVVARARHALYVVALLGIAAVLACGAWTACAWLLELAP